MVEFTRDTLIEAFAALGQRAHAAGRVIDIAVYGGSCLMLASNFRRATRDVDAVVATEDAFFRDAARALAAERGWPADWINDGVATYLSPAAPPPQHHDLFRAFPSERECGLRVFVPTAEYMLAMKLMALRSDGDDGKSDLGDAVALLAVVSPPSRDDIVALAAAFYPEARVSGKLRLALDQLWRAYQERSRKGGPDAPRYLGRTGA